MEDSFVISQSKLSLLRQYQPRVCSLFAVSVEINQTAGHVPTGYGSLVCIRRRPRSPELSQQQQQQQQDVRYAKEYILSLVADDEDSWSEKVFYSPQQFDVLKTYLNEIEANSRAVVNIREDEFSVQIHGLLNNRKLAQNHIELILREHESATTKETLFHTDASTLGLKSRGEMVTNRTKQHPHPQCLSPGADSCYGSSDDVPPELPPRTRKAGHRDGPYLSSPVSSSPPGHSGSGSSSSLEGDPEVDRIQSDSGYIAKVEFGVKLGYSEAQVLSVLKKLGLNAPQNELLSELISLGTCTSKSQVSFQDREKASSAFVEMDNRSVSPYEGGGASFGASSTEDGTSETLSVPYDTDFVRCSDQSPSGDPISGYRPIVIDGSNVAMSHGNKAVFSCRGIQLAVEWFRKKGCKEITVFVPQWRKESPRQDAPIEDQHILSELERDGILSFTPARRIGGKRMVCYDDRYVLKLAAETGGIVVSNDNYRDLLAENEDFKKVVEERLLMYSFVRDMFMPPDDPLGRHGPSLENFLRTEPTEPEPLPLPCPYGKKCTFGNKCKYYHADRGKSVIEKLAEQAKQGLQDLKDRSKTSEDKKKGGKKQKQSEKKPLARTDSTCPSLPLSEESIPPPRPPRKPTTPQKTHTDILAIQGNNYPEFKAYNDRLSELSKNIPKEGVGKLAATDPMAVPDVNIEMSVPPGLPDSSLWPPADMATARTGPQLVTGHLAVAQTLSDEANREQRQKSLKQQQEELKQDLKCTQHPLAYVPSGDDLQHFHLAMDSQLSLHGPADASMSPRGSPFSTELVQENAVSRASIGDLREYSQGPYYSADSLPFNTFNSLLLSSDEQFSGELRGLMRTNSSTCQPSLRLKPPASTNMNRQNSTSDPMLNQQSVPVLPNPMPQKPLYKHYPAPVYSRPPMQPHVYNSSPYMTHGYDPHHGQYARAAHPDMAPAYYSTPTPPPAMLGPDVRSPPGGGWPLPQQPQQQQQQPPPPRQPAFLGESSYPIDAPIPVRDQRYSLYVHLSGIFPERSVRAVMNQFPHELNPRNICAHLVNLNH